MDEPSGTGSQDRVVWREVGDEAVILDLASSRYLRLNPTGTLLWKAIREGTAANELPGVLIDAFGVDGSRARADVTSFITDLTEHGLLTDPAAG